MSSKDKVVCSVCKKESDDIVTVDGRTACLHHHGVKELYAKENPAPVKKEGSDNE